MKAAKLRSAAIDFTVHTLNATPDTNICVASYLMELSVGINYYRLVDLFPFFPILFFLAQQII